MTSTDEFFEQLDRRGHEPMLRRVRAAIRFEATGPDAAAFSRLVRIDRGDVSVSTGEGDADADAVFACSTAEFEDLVSGRTSPMASLLRGTLTVEGDPELLVLAQRLFSGTAAAGTGRHQEEPR